MNKDRPISPQVQLGGSFGGLLNFAAGQQPTQEQFAQLTGLRSLLAAQAGGSAGQRPTPPYVNSPPVTVRDGH